MIMERIVQLRSDEYDSLVEKANLNESQINEKALMLYHDRGVAQLNIWLKHENDNSNSNFTFDCRTEVWYKDEKFYIPKQLRERLGKILKDAVLKEMREEYGDSEKLINKLKLKYKHLLLFKWIMFVVAVSGWVTLALYLCLS